MQVDAKIIKSKKDKFDAKVIITMYLRNNRFNFNFNF